MKIRINPFLLFFLFGAFNLFGQDLIITNSKEELKTKILEIEELLVKYKKFDFQDGPTYSIRKSDVFLIIYSNGTRETFTKNEVVNKDAEFQPSEKKQNYKENINSNTIIPQKNSPSQPNQGNTTASSEQSPNSYMFEEGDKLLGIGIGTGVFLGNSSAIATVGIPYFSARFDKIFYQFGDNMALGAGLYGAYHSYSIGSFSNESIFNVFSGGLSGSFYYNISEKLAVSAGLRILYVTIADSGSFGYTTDPVSSIDFFIYGAAYYKVSNKINLFSEFSSGISNVNIGCQFNF